MVTPQTEYKELAGKLNIPSLWLKREDLHPYKSHKGRSIPYMIDTAVLQGTTHFLISSSGNAALASVLHINKCNTDRVHKNLPLLTLEIFIGQKISAQKLSYIEDAIKALLSLPSQTITLTRSERPLQAMIQRTETLPEAYSLRQSTDDTALFGYTELAEELKEIPNISDIFIGTSSGTTAQALAQILGPKGIAVHVVQTTSCHPIADTFSSYPEYDEVSIADAIVDKVAHRKNSVHRAIVASNGSAIVVSNETIKIAQELSQSAIETISPNGALGIAGLMETLYTDFKPQGTVVCIVCGQ